MERGLMDCLERGFNLAGYLWPHLPSLLTILCKADDAAIVYSDRRNGRRNNIPIFKS